MIAARTEITHEKIFLCCSDLRRRNLYRESRACCSIRCEKGYANALFCRVLLGTRTLKLSLDVDRDTCFPPLFLELAQGQQCLKQQRPSTRTDLRQTTANSEVDSGRPYATILPVTTPRLFRYRCPIPHNAVRACLLWLLQALRCHYVPVLFRYVPGPTRAVRVRAARLNAQESPP